MTLGQFDLCAAALIKIGARPPASLTDGSAEAEVAARLYGLVRDGLLSAHPWTFATAQVRLNPLGLPPVADFRHAFALPVDHLKTLALAGAGGGRSVVYRINGRQLHADVAPVVLTHVFRPNEADCPAFFDRLLVAALAAEFCLPLTESAARADLLADHARELFREARRLDGQQDTPSALDDFSLIRARLG